MTLGDFRSSKGERKFSGIGGHVGFVPIVLKKSSEPAIFEFFNTICQKRKSPRYSIISSARASSVGGTVRPRAFAVLRLITNSSFSGAWTGNSLGFSPLRMRSA